MFKKSSVWLILLILMLAIALLATGCAKKSIIYKEAAGKPVLEAKKEVAPPAPRMEQPKAPLPPAPKVEVAPAPKAEAAPAPFDLTGMRIQFAFDDYILATHSKENLEKIASWMKDNPDARIQIQGNTCNIGTAEYNLALGEQRATSAKKYLEQLGIDGGRLSTVSYGLEKPRVPNTDEPNRSLNRRDEFVMR
jgi:outer membrane protein OmpA-like peptidoglycan-associated protein